MLGDGAFGHVSAALLPGSPAANLSTHRVTFALIPVVTRCPPSRCVCLVCLHPPLCWPPKTAVEASDLMLMWMRAIGAVRLVLCGWCLIG